VGVGGKSHSRIAYSNEKAVRQTTIFMFSNLEKKVKKSTYNV
jgi:hypothetical protein